MMAGLAFPLRALAAASLSTTALAGAAILTIGAPADAQAGEARAGGSLASFSSDSELRRFLE